MHTRTPWKACSVRQRTLGLHGASDTSGKRCRVEARLILQNRYGTLPFIRRRAGERELDDERHRDECRRRLPATSTIALWPRIMVAGLFQLHAEFEEAYQELEVAHAVAGREGAEPLVFQFSHMLAKAYAQRTFQLIEDIRSQGAAQSLIELAIEAALRYSVDGEASLDTMLT